jgi:hypothetical protein
MNEEINIKFTPTKPRNMVKVLADLEYIITSTKNVIPDDALILDIDYLISRLELVKDNLHDAKKVTELFNPSVNKVYD